MEKNTPHFEKFVALATRLCQVCEAPTRQEIQGTQTDIQTRWQKLFGELQGQTEMFRASLQQWLTYEDEFVRARTWLEVKESLCDDLLYGKEPRDSNLFNCKVSVIKLLTYNMNNNDIKKACLVALGAFRFLIDEF